MEKIEGLDVHITGIVQGVGFRPFVYKLARNFELKGWVRNTSAGVDIEIDGLPTNLDDFVQSLETQAPPLARIDEILLSKRPAKGYQDFGITPSETIPDAFQPVSPDVCICSDCLDEMLDQNDRRNNYPFINCTNCGPRFTIIDDIPYDRPNTTMHAFDLCPECASEYFNPLDRRFHAQPVACPVCGPQVWLEKPRFSETRIHGQEAISETQRLLNQGKVIAIKGLGGFHLACDALNPSAVSLLRNRKLRIDKPFALMMPDVETIKTHCYVADAEEALLISHQRPIVILQKRPSSNISTYTAPGQDTLGVMLPYTPLHYLLFYNKDFQENSREPAHVLVMTSGNLGEEPIAIDNDEARVRIATLADAFLMHNRPIRTRCDDSVYRVMKYSNAEELPSSSQTLYNASTPLRRSRGYVPDPIHLPWKVPPILATGAELKNTFCLTRENYAFLSHHIGDLENFETLKSFEEGILHFESLFRIQPVCIAYDLHPDYLATRYALDRSCRENIPAYGIQHHHAHIAACMAENGFTGDDPVIGISFDGTGYGEDGAIWGGEILIANYSSYKRPYHLEYVPLPGGDKAIKEPWRMALSWLSQAGIPWSEKLPPISFALQRADGENLLNVIKHQIKSGINAPSTSSVGRLFDAVAAIIGIREQVNYEAQAAIEFEVCLDASVNERYRIPIPKFVEGNSHPIDASLMVKAIVDDYMNNTPISVISARFHNSIVNMVVDVCNCLRDNLGINYVALSGGVWQNMTLLEKTVSQLYQHEFEVLLHNQVPTNDGGLSLGQSIIAVKKFLQS